jgi:hypothetical protein
VSAEGGRRGEAWLDEAWLDEAWLDETCLDMAGSALDRAIVGTAGAARP